MKQNKTKLDNGLRILTNEVADAGSVTVSIFVGAGGRYEDLKTEYGVSHFWSIYHLRAVKNGPLLNKSQKRSMELVV